MGRTGILLRARLLLCQGRPERPAGTSHAAGPARIYRSGLTWFALGAEDPSGAPHTEVSDLPAATSDRRATHGRGSSVVALDVHRGGMRRDGARDLSVKVPDCPPPVDYRSPSRLERLAHELGAEPDELRDFLRQLVEQRRAQCVGSSYQT